MMNSENAAIIVNTGRFAAERPPPQTVVLRRTMRFGRFAATVSLGLALAPSKLPQDTT